MGCKINNKNIIIQIFTTFFNFIKCVGGTIGGTLNCQKAILTNLKGYLLASKR